MRPLPAKLLLNPVHFLSFGFGTGYFPRAPGTAGTVAGVVLYLLVRDLPWLYYLVLTAGMYAVGLLICARTASALGVHDHPAIVWDEMVGYLATMFLAPGGWPWVVLGFIIFRIFDIVKPWPINRLDDLKGSNGIMADDLLAGIFSLTVLQIIAYILER